MDVDQNQRRNFRATAMASKARPRMGSKVGKEKCPIDGCIGEAVNIKLHIAQWHTQLTKQEQKQAVELRRKFQHLKAITD